MNKPNEISIFSVFFRLASSLLKALAKVWRKLTTLKLQAHKKMKLKLTLIGLIAIVATCSVANGAEGTPTDASQTAINVAAAPAEPAPLSQSAQDYLKEKAAAAAAATPEATPVAATTTVTTTVTTPAAPATIPAPTPAPAAETVVTTTTTAPAAAPAITAAVTTVATSTNQADTTSGGHDPSAVIPLIVMDEVPLIDAIKNLARQASLNYMLDPKVNYGTPGPDGQIKAQPTVSLRWENLTADQALSAVLDNNNLTIIDDPKTHIARITVKDPAAPDPLVTKIVQLKYASATNMMMSASSILLDKRSKVICDNRTSQLVVVATEKEMATIDELVARLDTPTKQVLIEARIIETSKNPTSAKGVDWSGTASAQHVVFGNNVTGGQSGNPYSVNATTFTTNPVTGGFIATTGLGVNNLIQNPGLLVDTAKGFDPTTAFLNADGVSAVLSFLNTSADTQVLSTPRAVTLDNEEATLSVTTAEPIFLTTAGTQGSPGGSQVIYTNIGTILHVTPRISANNTISLKVIPEVSDIGIPVQKTVGGLVNQADVFQIRRIETCVLIPSGNTLVMGGLVDDNRSKGNTKVPVLGDIPYLGAAFRSESKTQNKKNLIIFVTPTIVQNEDFQPTETSFLKTKVPHLKSSDFGAWDSGEPQDWSKLMHSKKDKPSKDDDTIDVPTTN